MAVMGVRIGIYNQYMSARGGGEKRTLALAAHFSRKHEVLLIVHERPDLSSLERYFDVDLGRVKVVSLDESRSIVSRLKASQRLLSPRWKESVARFVMHRHIKSLGLDVFVNNSYRSDLACPAPLGIYMCMFPHAPPDAGLGHGLKRGLFGGLAGRVKRSLLGYNWNPIDTYTEVTANSVYTREWIEKLWGRCATVVYSACDRFEAPHNDAKEKMILNVGRFDVNKRQDILLDVFKSLGELHQAGWQLHFVGSNSRRAEARDFTTRLQEEARGYPVFFHFDAELETLRGLLRRASIYWHATGYGLSADAHPDKQEHFGMATVEAMSAGVVPVVINSGGQLEIVRQGIDGFLWDDLRSLAENTQLLASDEHLRHRLGRHARNSVANFSRAAFNEKMDEILERLLCEHAKATTASDGPEARFATPCE